MLLTLTVERKAQNRATLVFHHYRSQYFFAQAWVDGDSAGSEPGSLRLNLF